MNREGLLGASQWESSFCPKTNRRKCQATLQLAGPSTAWGQPQMPLRWISVMLPRAPGNKFDVVIKRLSFHIRFMHSAGGGPQPCTIEKKSDIQKSGKRENYFSWYLICWVKLKWNLRFSLDGNNFVVTCAHTLKMGICFFHCFSW